MCVAVPAAVWIASAVLTVASAAYQVDANKKMGAYEAEVAQQNKDLNNAKAEQAAVIGASAEDAQRAKVRQAIGAQRASLAANGIDLGSGTAEDMVAQTAQFGEYDALTTRYNAMNEAWGYRTEAINDQNAAAFAKARTKNANTGIYLSTAASLASSAYGGYASGAFGGGGNMAISQATLGSAGTYTPMYGSVTPMLSYVGG